MTTTAADVPRPPRNDQALEALLESVRPVLRGVIRRRLAGAVAAPRERQCVDDAYAETVGLLVRRFRNSEDPESDRDVRNLNAFAAATASHVCDAYVRRRYPLRARLRRRL